MKATTYKLAAVAMLFAFAAIAAMPAHAGDCPQNTTASASAAKSQVQKSAFDGQSRLLEMYGP
ncbi:hypothetical protein [Thauera chlorobenzoica]|uniref:hypothetical protein n=1 Tax=Thauera chlorobenzoica TaxID=96773 RepID=UPI00089FFB6D|nr:hypothetical protein [Thauera chlorobenzoica]SEG10505.1 hypothetical protein SAMN05216242_11755 [Thauera chlorobenzoica]